MNPVSRSFDSVPEPVSPMPRLCPVPVKRPAVGSGFHPGTGLWKYCFECQGYYQGQLDGEYRCPDCRHAGRSHERALAPLDGTLSVVPESLSIVPRHSPERVYAEIDTAKRQVIGGRAGA